MIQDRLLILANLYNPNKEPQQIEVMDNFISIIKSIDRDHECEIVLGGDFNFIFNTELESDGGNPKLKLSSIATFNSLSNEFSLVDIWRVRNPDKKNVILFDNQCLLFKGDWTSFSFLIHYRKMLKKLILYQQSGQIILHCL